MVNGFTEGVIPDSQMSALLMAICFNGMTEEETASLTLAMMESGEMLTPSEQLGRSCVDKHSTGGVGDKTTLIAAPVCAACGLYVPKMSGRGLGHTGGTIDKLESIPGMNTSLDYDKFIDVVRKAGFASAAQTGTLVPADKKIYALRNMTATVDSIPLISSSIMSKKLATGAEAIVLDVKTGDGAFMKTVSDSEKLARSMMSAAKVLGRRCTAVITDMSKPLGKAVGNGIEVIEAAEALKGRCPADLYDVSVTLAAQMLMLGGAGEYEKCVMLAKDAIESGKAFHALEKTVELQGGDKNALTDYSLLGVPKFSYEVRSSESGYISRISCEKTGILSMKLGAGRQNKDDQIDPTAGILFDKTVGDYAEKGSLLGTLYTSSECDLKAPGEEFAQLFSFSAEPPAVSSAVLKIISDQAL